MSKVVVITGASAGIGEELAKQLVGRGDRVVLAARREAELARVAEPLGDAARVVVTDVTKRADIERLRDRALEAFDRVDVWVNNAGRGIAKPTLQLTDEDIDQMLAVNLKSALYGMQAIMPHFQQRGSGQVINISSFLGKVPVVAFRSIYSAAKAALNSLSSSVRMDLMNTYPDIHVSTVMPGVVLTGFHSTAVGADKLPPRELPTSGPAKPQTVTEVAAAIVGVIDEPRAELYTNPMHPDIARQYVADPAALETKLASQ